MSDLFRREDEDPVEYQKAVMKAFNHHEYLLRKERGRGAPRYWLYGSWTPCSDGTGVGWEVRDELTKKVLATHETRVQAKAHADTLNGLPGGAFHWRDGLFFRRTQDGSVVIVRVPADEKASDFVAVIDAASWNSIIASCEPAYLRTALTRAEGSASPPPPAEGVGKLVEAARRASEYLNALGDNLLRNDADMQLDDCEDPKDVAERLLAAAEAASLVLLEGDLGGVSSASVPAGLRPTPTPRSDGRAPLTGYALLPPGVRCKCLKLWQGADGEYWCCNPNGALTSESPSVSPSNASAAALSTDEPKSPPEITR